MNKFNILYDICIIIVNLFMLLKMVIREKILDFIFLIGWIIIKRIYFIKYWDKFIIFIFVFRLVSICRFFFLLSVIFWVKSFFFLLRLRILVFSFFMDFWFSMNFFSVWVYFIIMEFFFLLVLLYILVIYSLNR